MHRDLKLANILLHFPEKDLLSLRKEERLEFLKNFNFKDTSFEVKISDFGFAKRFEAKDDFLNQTICGTPAYMAPDQLVDNKSNYSDKIDVWSLGSIYYELMIGHPPFFEKTLEKFKVKVS